MASRRSAGFRAYRICKNIFPILSGDGAARHPGRRNSLGHPVVYASETFSGAMLEILVHANIGRPPRDLHFATITAPPSVSIEELSAADIADWSDVESTRLLGDAWYAKRRAAVLLVPGRDAARAQRRDQPGASGLRTDQGEQAEARGVGSAALP